MESALLGAVLGSIITAALTLGLPAFRRWVNAPRLWLDIDHKRTGELRRDRLAAAEIPLLPSGVAPPALSSDLSTGHDLTTTARAAFTDGMPQLWRWYHVEITNIGSSRATNCRGFLEVLYEAQGDSFRPVPQWVNRLPLRWANTGGQTQQSIDARQSPFPRLDLFRISVGDPGAIVMEFVGTEPHIGLPTVFTRLSKWRALVAVEGDNVKTSRALFEIDLANGPDAIALRKLPRDLVDARVRSA